MGRSSASERLNHHHLRLEIKPPSLFRCPISLEVMRSPVSLVTGVTYDRASIQRWLDSGNTTCPTTMLPLPTTDLIPNLTLRRLINIWSSSTNPDDDYAPADEPLTHLEKLAAFLADPDVDDAVKNGVINAGDFVRVVVSAVVDRDGGELNLKVVEAAIEVVCVIINSDWIEEGNKERLISSLSSDLDATIASLIIVLRDGSKLKSKTNSARILQALLSVSESKILVQERLDALVPELIRLIRKSSLTVIDEGLGCLIMLLPSKQAVKSMVQSKLVPALVRTLSSESLSISSRVSERAIMMLEAAANCTEGRSAISEMVEECVQAVMGRMMKVGKEGREAAIGLLWGVCYSSWGDRRGKEAVTAVSGGMTKILVVMQGNCSPTVRRMAGDLLRVFRVNAKSLVAGYDTKTTHIMPF